MNSLVPITPSDLRACKRCGRTDLAWVPVTPTGSRFRLVYTRHVRGILCALVRYRHSCDDGECMACPDPGCDGLSFRGVSRPYLCGDCGHEGADAPGPRDQVAAPVTERWLREVMG